MAVKGQRFFDIHKYALGAAIAAYLIGVFCINALQPGIIFVLGAGFFNLFHKDYFMGRPKLAAHIWLIPALMACMTYSLLIERVPGGQNTLHLVIVMMICLVPFLMLMFGKPEEIPSKKSRLKIINTRILVQCTILMLWAVLTAISFINGTKIHLLFWGLFHALTVAFFPFLIGRVICGWLCPNSVFQDALFKNMTYRRPISKLPKAIEEQTCTASMTLSDGEEGGEDAPLVPATLLFAWFPVFFIETVFDLAPTMWYPLVFFYGLVVLSMLFPWRKLCTHFCWMSSYRCLAGHNSLWRIRFNKSKCRKCKRCLAEEGCPFYIDIRNQDNEMPVTCCLCFNCMEACPFDDVITFRRSKEEKQRLKLAGL